MDPDMARLVRKLHKRIGDVKSKLYTWLWYRFLFFGMGKRCTINPPFFTHRSEYIELGRAVSIGPFCRIEAHPAHPGNRLLSPIIKIGNRVRIEHGVNISCHRSLIIEDEVLIAGGSYVGDNNHSIDPRGPRYLEQPLTSTPTMIGRGAWLGQNVCVLAGSVIGERSVIGAGSVVNGHIPPYSIAVGIPARVIKQYNFKTGQWERISRVDGLSKMRKGG